MTSSGSLVAVLGYTDQTNYIHSLTKLELQSIRCNSVKDTGDLQRSLKQIAISLRSFCLLGYLTWLMACWIFFYHFHHNTRIFLLFRTIKRRGWKDARFDFRFHWAATNAKGFKFNLIVSWIFSHIFRKTWDFLLHWRIYKFLFSLNFWTIKQQSNII